MKCTEFLKLCKNIKRYVILSDKPAFFHKKTKNKLRGFSPQANYTDQATAACRHFSG
jgi:hypothetical protein